MSTSPSSSSPHEEMEGRDTAGIDVGHDSGTGGGGGDGSGGGGDGSGGDGDGGEAHRELGSVQPSTSGRPRRRRFGNRIWPAPFLEALAIQVAIDATRNFGRLAAASALYNLFQVCSTWRAISRSDLLWQNLASVVWNRKHLLRDTWNWHDEYIYRHRTAHNFYINRYIHSTIPIPPPENNDWDNNGLMCLRLALSDRYFAAGFSNGMVQLYLKSSREQLAIFYPEQRDRLGRFPSAVTGIILSRDRLVFASLDGDIRVVLLPHLAPPTGRLAHRGDIVRDGSLVDFTGAEDRWVGLYAGAPGRAFHVWNSETEEIIFIGGTLTDPESLQGWRLLTHISNLVGRVRISRHGIATACTARRAIEFSLEDLGVILGEEEFLDPDQALMVRCFDATDESMMLVDAIGRASIRNALNEERYRFRVRAAGGVGLHEEQVVGCMNYDYVMIYEINGGVIRVWKDNGRLVNRIRERLDRVTALVADETHILASSSTSLHLWDFGADVV